MHRLPRTLAAAAAPGPPSRPPEETAPPEERPGETEESRGTFAPLAVVDKALRHKHPAIVPKAGNRHFLVTAFTRAEGPSGFATSGEIPPGASSCSP